MPKQRLMKVFEDAISLAGIITWRNKNRRLRGFLTDIRIRLLGTNLWSPAIVSIFQNRYWTANRSELALAASVDCNSCSL
jgi:hypothetical protein